MPLILVVQLIDKGKDFGNRLVEFTWDFFTNGNLGQQFDKIRILPDMDSRLAGGFDYFFSNLSPAFFRTRIYTDERGLFFCFKLDRKELIVSQSIPQIELTKTE